MKTVIFTNKNLMSWLAMILFSVFTLNMQAQVCSVGSNVTLGPDDCEAKILALQLSFSGAKFTKVDLIELGEHVEEGDTRVIQDPIIGDLGYSVRVFTPGKYKYVVSYDNDQECWGTFNVEDKNGPKCIAGPGNADLDNDHAALGGKLSILNTDDDLFPELVSCTRVEDGSIERFYDLLEADDFMDCSSLRDEDVFFIDKTFEVCGEMPSNSTMKDNWDLLDGEASRRGFKISDLCEIRSRTWFVADWHGNVSEGCTQYIFVVRPTLVHIDMNPGPFECGTDPQVIEDASKPYLYDFPYPIGKSTEAAPYKIRIGDGEHFCKFAASKHQDDTRIDVCDEDKAGIPDGTCEKLGLGKQIQHWTVIDWCTGQKVPGWIVMPGKQKRPGLLDEVTQIVETKDSKEPVFGALPKPSIWTNPYDCTIEVKFPKIYAKDDCAGQVEADYQVFVYKKDEHGGNVYGGSFEDYSAAEAQAGFTAEKGSYYKILARAWDCCDNTGYAEDRAELDAEDDYAPICIANDELEVSLVKTDVHESGIHSVGARVYPEDIDDTSRDNCGIKYMQIREAKKHQPGVAPLKDDEGWKDYVTYSFTNEEYDKIAGEKCELEMWVDLLVVDHNDNYSICPSRLILRDNTPAEITKIGMHQAYSCLDKVPTPGGIEVWGNCYEEDEDTKGHEFHCPVELSEALDKVVDLTQELIYALAEKRLTDDETVALLSENMGGIPVDALENLWFSRVDVTAYDVVKKTEHGASHDFAAIAIFEYTVEDETFVFPQDFKGECSAEGIPAPAKLDDILTNRGCSEWVMNVTEKTFYGAEDACYKIIRNYEFINWCRWDENLRDDDSTIDKDCADKDGDDKILGSERVSVTYKKTGSPAGICNTSENLDLVEQGYFNYIQVIKIVDSVDPEGSITSKETCDPSIDGCEQGVVEFEVTPSDDCSEASITDWYVDGSDKFKREGNKIYAKGLAKGKYTLHVRIDDECGNFIWVTKTSGEVWNDCKKPTAIAHEAYTALMENCTVDIWLNEVLVDVYDNCPKDELTVGMEIVDAPNLDAASPELPRDNNDDPIDYVTLTTAGTSIIAIHVEDAEGNRQVTFVPVTAVDNSGTCGGVEMADVAGQITNENDEMIDNVTVTAKGSEFNPFSQLFSGFFNFNAIPMHTDVEISAQKNHGFLNGVSTADLVQLQRHVLGITQLGSAYKLIAADANNDEAIDTRDMLHISRLILGIYDELPNNTSWRFVDKNFNFVNPSQPWGFPEAINYTDLGAQAQADFVGIKVGDLTGNALPTQLLGTDNTTVGTMKIAIEDATIAAGETRTIQFTTKDFADFSGYQFSIALDSRVEFNAIDAGELNGVSEANFGLNALESGVITTNWVDVEGATVENGTVMFELTVTAKQTVNVSDVLTVNSAVTTAEAYNSNLDVYSVAVQFNRAAEASFELFQNTPNPVSGETIIGFNLPTAGQATLKVMDVAGRTLKVVNGEYTKGYNQVALDKSDLGATGVLYYQLDTDNNSATKKMIILD